MTTASQKQIDYAADLVTIYSNTQLSITGQAAADEAINTLLIDSLRAVLSDATSAQASQIIDACKSRNVKSLLAAAGLTMQDLTQCLQAAGVA